MPGLAVHSNGLDEVVTSSRGASSIGGGAECVRYFVDDAPWLSIEPGDINTFVNGNEVVAVEVYQGPVSPRSTCAAWTGASRSFSGRGSRSVI